MELIDYAKTLVGTPYKKLDCSAFVRKAFRHVGVSLPRTSVAQGKYLYNKKLTIDIAKSETPADIKLKLEPGQTLYWGNPKYKSRWRNIHHTSIYIGDGKNAESSSSKGKVVIRNIWESSDWQIIMIGKPLSLVKPPEPPKPEYYTVKKGDNLTRIAVKYHMTVSKILELNPDIKNPNLIHVKQKIRVR